MKKSQRLTALVRIEEAKEREEARKFAELQKEVEEQKRKLSDLQGYLEEYKYKLSAIGQVGTEAAKLRSSFAFIGQLNTVISQQQKAVLVAEHAAGEYRQNWIRARQRVDILEKAISKVRDEELRHELKLEQVLADESARHRRRDL